MNNSFGNGCCPVFGGFNNRSGCCSGFGGGCFNTCNRQDCCSGFGGRYNKSLVDKGFYDLEKGIFEIKAGVNYYGYDCNQRRCCCHF